MPGPAQDQLRILFLSHYANPHIGGIEVTVASLSRIFRARGHEVIEISSAAGAERAGQESDDGPIRIPAWNGLEQRAGIPYPLFAPRLLGEVKRRVRWADVVHAHGFLYMPSLVGLHYARRARRNADRPAGILTEYVGHVEYSNRALNGAQTAAIASLGRYAVRTADAITVANERVEAEVRRLGAPGPIEVISSGVDTKAFRPPEPEERAAIRAELGWDARPRVLFVGRMVEKKGAGVAIEASRAAGGAFELVMAGPGELTEAPPNVRRLGPVGHDEIARLFRAADAFLLPSHGEGLPLSAVEALASGLPVFLSEDPVYSAYAAEIPEAVKLVGPDPKRISAVVLSVLESDAAREAASRRGPEYAGARFSWERIADQYEAGYRATLERCAG